MSHALRIAAITAAASLLLASCAGYRLGGAKPAAYAGVKTIAVPMFANRTLEPRVEALATSATVAALAADGTYRVVPASEADAILQGTVTSVNYTQLRSDRLDTLRPAELRNDVWVTWTLQDARNPGRVLGSNTAYGTSHLFLTDPNTQTERTNALPDAIRGAATAIVSQLADGF